MAATPIPHNQASFTPEEIVRITGAEVIRAADRAIEGVVLDSRGVVPGNLFVALRGETHDAHDYVEQAVEGGAHALLVERPVPAPEHVGLYLVKDTLEALGALGAAHRQRFATIPVVGITGSVGKTTTKELVAAALAGIGRTPVFTRGNLNNRIGVPMTLFTIDASHDAAVIEMGMNEPGEIADLARMAAPTVGVVTSVAEVHTEGVGGGLDGVAREKGALLLAIAEEGAVCWCADDPELAPYAERSAADRKVPYGRTEAAALRLSAWELDGHGGTRARFTLPADEGGTSGRELDVGLSLLGEHVAVDAAGALAVVWALARDRVEDAARALAEVTPPPHRMVPVELESGLLIVDDSYNASPRSTVAALEAGAALASARGGHLIAVLGDMLELGPREAALHADVGRAAVRSRAKAVIACGERMTHAGRAALQATMESGGPRTKVVLLRSVEDAARCVRELAAPADVVVVKGSRGMRMERVVDALRDEERP